MSNYKYQCEECRRKYTAEEAAAVCKRMSAEDGGGFLCEDCDTPLQTFEQLNRTAKRLE